MNLVSTVSQQRLEQEASAATERDVQEDTQPRQWQGAPSNGTSVYGWPALSLRSLGLSRILG